MSLGSSNGLIMQVASIKGLPSLSSHVTSKHIFVASMMHTSMRSPVLRDKPDVTCPSDFPDSERRKEVAHHEQIPDHDVSKSRKNAPDKKSNVVIKAKNIPVTPKAVASSQGAIRERWLVSIYKEIENFLQNMAIEDADPSLVVRWKSSGRWPLPCQVVFVLKPLTQSQQMGNDVQAEYKHKRRLVICGNYGSLQKALESLLQGFHRSINLREATSGQLDCMTITVKTHGFHWNFFWDSSNVENTETKKKNICFQAIPEKGSFSATVA